MTSKIASYPSPAVAPDGSVLPPRSDTPTLSRVTLLDVGFHALSMSDAIETIQGYVEARTPRQICMANAYTVSLAQTDIELRTLLNSSDLVLADGMSIVWGARWIKLSLPGRIAGPDLMKAVCAISAEQGYRIFLMGSTPENLVQLQRVLETIWPSIRIVGSYSPPFVDRLSDEENKSIFQALENAKPDVLFVSMSAPKQEKWIAHHLARLQAPVCIGVGAAFDFLSGRIPRAPNVFQRSGLEWLYRLGCEPRRLWKRYLLGNAVYLSLLAKQFVRMKFSFGRKPPNPSETGH